MNDARQLSVERLGLGDIAAALHYGRACLRAMPLSSIAYAAIFMLLGLVLLSAIVMLGLSPLVLPIAGGFMLLGPVLLAGYFELALRHEQGEKATLGDALGAFPNAPPQLWAVALVCALLFLIWITDAGTLYSFTLGGAYLGPDLDWIDRHGLDVLHFQMWGSLMGSLLAYLIFVVSAFSVPLLYERRAALVPAISASVRGVLGNFFVSLAWGVILAGVTMLSILLLPTLLLTLPILSFASFGLYRRAFPLNREDAGIGKSGTGQQPEEGNKQ